MAFKLTKKSFAILLFLAIIIILGATFFLISFQKLKEEAKIPEPIEEIKKEEKREDILKALTPPSPKPLTEKEKKELEESLKKLTPLQPKPLTEKEKKELEELLKKLTP